MNFFHPILSRASLVASASVNPLSLQSSSIQSSHLFLGRPLPLFSSILLYIATYGNLSALILSSSSLVLCLSAGPWQPTPPLFSILRPPLHTNIRSLHEVVNHPNPWSAPRSLILHSSFQHKL